MFSDGTDVLIKKGLGLEFFHVASGATAIFKAFLNQYEDSFKSEWNSEKVYGRMDPIHTFQGTERTISLGWDVPSADFDEAEKNFKNASTMYSMLYPAYSPGSAKGGHTGGVITAPPMVKLKFGNLIFDADSEFDGGVKDSGLLGWISDLSFAPDLESGFFDEKPNFLIPQTIKLNCTFHVLHTHKLGWDAQSKSLRKEKGNFPYSGKVSDDATTENESTKVPAGTATGQEGGMSMIPPGEAGSASADLAAQNKHAKTRADLLREVSTSFTGKLLAGKLLDE